MDGIGPVWGNSPVSQIYFNPVYNTSGVSHAVQAGLAGILPIGQAQPAGSSVVTNIGSTAEDELRMKNLKKAGLIECQTCKNRTYQDGSDDPGVSFKAPGHIDPDNSAAVVMSHEQEHVSNETAKARSEGRRVVSQSVSLYTAVCPECGRTYVSGGTTRTTTAGDTGKDYFKQQYQNTIDKNFGRVINARL